MSGYLDSSRHWLCDPSGTQSLMLGEHQPWPSSTTTTPEAGGITPWQRGWLPGAGRQGMLLHQPNQVVFWQRGAAGAQTPGPPAPSPLPSLGPGRRAQQAAPGHRRSYKLLGRAYKRANPCSHRTGFVPSPEPSLTINQEWVLFLVFFFFFFKRSALFVARSWRSRSPFRRRQSAGEAEMFVNIVMIVLKSKCD